MSNNKVLALDLEGTLISNAVSQFPRPGLHLFLSACQELFDRIVMFTTVREDTFRSIARTLVEESAAPAWFATLEVVTWEGKTKDLRYVPGSDVPDVYLVDDLEQYVHPGQQAQWVRIEQFMPPFEESTDDELSRVLQKLRQVAQSGA